MSASFESTHQREHSQTPSPSLHIDETRQKCEKILTVSPQKMVPKANFRLPNIRNPRTKELCLLFKKYHTLYTDLVNLYNIVWEQSPLQERKKLPKCPFQYQPRIGWSIQSGTSLYRNRIRFLSRNVAYF